MGTIGKAKPNGAGGLNILLEEPRNKWATRSLLKRIAWGHIDPEYSTYQMKLDGVGKAVEHGKLCTQPASNEDGELSVAAEVKLPPVK